MYTAPGGDQTDHRFSHPVDVGPGLGQRLARSLAFDS